MSIFKMPYNYDALMGECPDESNAAVFSKLWFASSFPDRTAITLLAVIRERIEPGSVVMSNCWRAYNMIGADGTYKHLTVNHKYNFVDPESDMNYKHYLSKR